MLAATVLLLLLALGLASTVYSIATARFQLLGAPVTWQAFVQGQTMRAMADALAEAPSARAAAQAVRAANWWVLDDLGPQVRQGCPGWLFLTEELMPREDGAYHLMRRAQVVSQVHAALQARGIGLLVAVVPDKSRIEHQHLCKLQRGASLQGRLQDWTAQMQALKVPMVDLSAALATLPQGAGTAFFRTDTHWSEAGAQRAAQALAEAVPAHWPGWRPEPLQDWDAVREASAVRPGDLVRLAGLERLPPRWQPSPETTHAVRFEPRAAARPAAQAGPEDEEESLFGDDELPRTVLVGTSFSRTAGFAGFLAQQLRTTVVNFGRDGGNFSGGAAAYFQSRAWQQTPPRWLIWEIPERTLQRPVQASELAEWQALPGVASVSVSRSH